MLIISPSHPLINHFKAALQECYEISDLGPAHWLLGFKLHRDRKRHIITISQQAYIDSTLALFNMTTCAPVSTPMAVGTILSKVQTDIPTENNTIIDALYCEAIGKLMYLSLESHPDITFSVNLLAQFSNCPTMDHWCAVKRIFHYLKRTRNLVLTLGGNTNPLTGYSDSDWGSQPDRCHTLKWCQVTCNETELTDWPNRATVATGCQNGM